MHTQAATYMQAIFTKCADKIRARFTSWPKRNTKSDPWFKTSDAFIEQGFTQYTATCKRPGQKTFTIVCIACPEKHFLEISMLAKKILPSMAGKLENAIEQGVQRCNETMYLKRGAREWGDMAIIAIEGEQFAIAAGGNVSALLKIDVRASDASPALSDRTRDKPFAAFVAGILPERASLAISFNAVYPDTSHPAGRETSACIEYQRETVVARISIMARYTKSITLCMHHVRYYAANPKIVFEGMLQIVRRVVREIQKVSGNASPKNKALAAGVIILAFLALRTIFIAIGAQTVDHIITETLERQARIEQLVAKNKEKEALELIDQSLTFIENAPQRLNQTQKNALENLRMRMLISASGITKLSIIPDPQPVVSMEKSFRAGRSFDLQGLALSHGKLYTVNRAEKEIYELDGKERRIVVLKDFPPGSGAPIGLISASPGVVQIITENLQGVLELDPNTRKFSFTHITSPHANTQPAAWAAYQNRIYLLDARSRAIYRYEKTDKGYDQWSPWTGENTLDLTQATALTVDGAIYVAFNDQYVVRLVQGNKTAFNIEKIRPPLEQITAIATKEESPLLYMLDRPQRRVLVVSKEDGALVAQYMSPAFTDLRGLFPDEAGRKIYLLNGDTIYAVGPNDKDITNTE